MKEIALACFLNAHLLWRLDGDGGEWERLGFHATRAVVPIAVGRSRRHVAKVDYKFGAYDELIQVC
uniref:Uncharacterized protein n=1 Tax=Parascaris equorum TaxID=6256 RepID=A0A914REF2_PAREQ